MRTVTGRFGVWQSWSIQRKLVVSLVSCLLVFSLVSGGLSVWLIGKAAQERIVGDELPAAVAAIRADVQRQITEPLAISSSIASNTYLLKWDAEGLPDSGMDAWKTYAQALKAQYKAATVFWVSQSTGKYLGEAGLNRTITDKDGWFRDFLASGKPYTLDLDKDVSSNVYMLFINARIAGPQGKQGVAGLGLSVDAMAQSIRNYRLGQTGSAFMVRPNGVIMVHRDVALADGKHTLKDAATLDDAQVRLLLDGKPFSYVKTSQGQDRFVASAFVPELNAYVVAEVPQAELLGSITRAIQIAALIATVIGSVIALVIVLAVSRAIAGPVERAARLLGEIASGEGDLSGRMRVESNDEIGKLADAFNRFVSSLGDMVRQVRESADSIAMASSEVSSGNADLSHRTEQSAAALEETSSSMADLMQSVQNNAESAGQAAQQARAASTTAKESGEAVGQVVAVMGEIDASSRKIADIIGVIDGIAFQTNILALNAAVEAARAGEQGRGFAVVASEVRSLAGRSAEAAREVRSLIQASSQQVARGSALVTGAGQRMNGLVEEVNQVSVTIREISSSIQQQSGGIAEINTAISHLDNTTQQNAALVEQSSAAADSLREQAKNLTGVVSAFRL